MDPGVEDPFLADRVMAVCKETSADPQQRQRQRQQVLLLLLFLLLGMTISVVLVSWLDTTSSFFPKKVLKSMVTLRKQHKEEVRKGSMHTIEVFQYKTYLRSGGVSNGEHENENENENEQQQQRVVWKDSWKHFPEHSNLLRLDDSNVVSTGEILPIDIVHGSSGFLHRCITLAVLRRRRQQQQQQQQQRLSFATTRDNSQYEVLILQRQPHLKTCPGAWGLLGEHSDPGEQWIETAHRAMEEELNISIRETRTNHTKKITNNNETKEERNTTSFVNLLPENESILLQTRYPETNRRELQVNGLFAIVIHDDEEDQIQPDEDVAKTKWIPIHELETIPMCNEETSNLGKVVAHNLQQKGFF